MVEESPFASNVINTIYEHSFIIRAQECACLQCDNYKHKEKKKSSSSSSSSSRRRRRRRRRSNNNNNNNNNNNDNNNNNNNNDNNNNNNNNDNNNNNKEENTFRKQQLSAPFVQMQLILFKKQQNIAHDDYNVLCFSFSWSWDMYTKKTKELHSQIIWDISTLLHLLVLSSELFTRAGL